MSGRANAEMLQLALKAVNGRLSRAEFALSALVRTIREHSEEAQECARLLAGAAPLDCENSGFSAFADRRRDAVKARIAAIFAALEIHHTEEKIKRADVERNLRQKISIEAAETKARLEAAKDRTRRGQS